MKRIVHLQSALLEGAAAVVLTVAFGLACGCDEPEPRRADTDGSPGDVVETENGREQVGVYYGFTIVGINDSNIENERIERDEPPGDYAEDLIPNDAVLTMDATRALKLGADAGSAATKSTDRGDVMCCGVIKLSYGGFRSFNMRVGSGAREREHDIRTIDVAVETDKWISLAGSRFASIVVVWQLFNGDLPIRGVTSTPDENEQNPVGQYGLRPGQGSLILGYAATGEVLLHEMIHYKGASHREDRVPGDRNACTKETAAARSVRPMMCETRIVTGIVDQVECDAFWEREWGERASDHRLADLDKALCPIPDSDD